MEAPPDFLERAMRWMSDERIAAVFGPVRQVKAVSTADRWRGRHLFRLFDASRVNRQASLAMVRSVPMEKRGCEDLRKSSEMRFHLGPFLQSTVIFLLDRFVALPNGIFKMTPNVLVFRGQFYAAQTLVPPWNA